MAKAAAKTVVKKTGNKAPVKNTGDVDPDADEAPKSVTETAKAVGRGLEKAEVIKLTLPRDVADEIAKEQLEATREKADAQAVYNKLIVLDKKMDAMLSALNTVLAAQAKGFTVPVAPAPTTYGAEKREAPKKAPKRAMDAAEEHDPAGVLEGDFIIDGSDWYKVVTHYGKVGQGYQYDCVHHQTGESKKFKGTPKFLRRTKRKNTACWEMV